MTIIKIIIIMIIIKLFYRGKSYHPLSTVLPKGPLDSLFFKATEPLRCHILLRQH